MSNQPSDRKNVRGDAGITAGGDVSIGDITGSIAIGKNINQYRIEKLTIYPDYRRRLTDDSDYFKTSASINQEYENALSTQTSYKDILRKLKPMEKRFKTYLDDEKKLYEYGKYCLNYGDILRMSNQYNQASLYLMTAEKVFKACGVEECRAFALAKLAQTLTNKGDWSGAIDRIKKGFKILQRASGVDKGMKKRVEGELYKVGAQAQLLKYEYISDKNIPQKALQFSKKAEKNFKQLDSSYPLGHCQWDQGRIYRVQGKISEANGQIMEIDETFGKNRYGFQVWMVDDKIEILREESNQDPFKLTEAINMAKESLCERKRIGNLDRVAASYTVIAVLEGLSEHKFQAYRCFRIADGIYKKIKSEFGQKIVREYGILIKTREWDQIRQISFI